MNPDAVDRQQERIIAWLLQQAGPRGRLCETHISRVVVGPERAWKLKKPVRFPFLDFSTRTRRWAASRAELKLNRRFAAELYLDVRGVDATASDCRWSTDESTAEPVVCMRAFDEHELLAHRLADNRMTTRDFADLGRTVATMHAAAPPGPAPPDAGSPETVCTAMTDNLETLRTATCGDSITDSVNRISEWFDLQAERLRPLATERLEQGYVRACHGDLHLNNIVWWRHHPVAFDCIEFDPSLYWIDVLNDLAFLWMDLRAHDAGGGANVVLNSYLEQTGDYAGIPLLRWFAVYRAMVRAKIAVLSDAPARLERYLKEACRHTERRRPRLWITYGVSGSGKSTWTATWLSRHQVIRLRTDVERKRLDADGELPGERYASSSTHVVYTHCTDLAATLLDAGWDVIVDGTFLRRWQRDLARRAAQRAGADWTLLWFDVEEDELRRRIRQRAASATDASEATIDVLERQLRTMEPLSATEQAHAQHPPPLDAP